MDIIYIYIYIYIYRRTNHMDWQIDSFGLRVEVRRGPAVCGPASLWPCQWPKNGMQKIHQKSAMKKHQHEAKMMPKWSQNRCQNASKFDATFRHVKNTGKYGTSCFFDMQEHANLL